MSNDTISPRKIFLGVAFAMASIPGIVWGGIAAIDFALAQSKESKNSVSCIKALPVHEMQRVSQVKFNPRV